MGRDQHRWDTNIRDTRVRESRGDSRSGWSHSADSTFAEPSRNSEPVRAKSSPSRRLALRLAAGVGIAAVTGAAFALLRKRDSR